MSLIPVVAKCVCVETAVYVADVKLQQSGYKNLAITGQNAYGGR